MQISEGHIPDNLLPYGDVRVLTGTGSLIIGTETYLGPLYLAYGLAGGGHQSLYLYLGHKF